LLKTSWAKNAKIRDRKSIKLVIYYLHWRNSLVTAAYNYFKSELESKILDPGNRSQVKVNFKVKYLTLGTEVK
jgi:hypothetical protein